MAQVPQTQDPANQPAGGTATAKTPWENDLGFIEDEATRSAVSDYLGQKVQPYVTQLEQRAKPALDFYNDFQSEPGATTLDVIEELYGQDAAKNFAEYLTENFGDEGTQPNDPGTSQPANTDGQTPQNDPRLERMLNSWEQSEQEKEWAKALTDLQESNPDTEIDDMLFRPFAAMTDGDLDQALVGYKTFLDTAKAKFESGESTEETTEIKPPPALGAQGGGTPPPVEPTGQSIGDAIQGWVDDLKAQGQGVAPPHPEG